MSVGPTTLLTTMLAEDIGATARRWRRDAALYAAAGLFGLSAYAAALVGGTLALAESVGPVAAAFLVALGLLILAVAVVAGVMIVDRIEKRRAAAKRRGRTLLIMAAASALPAILRSRGLTLAALIGGGALLAAWGLGGTGDEGEDAAPH